MFFGEDDYNDDNEMMLKRKNERRVIWKRGVLRDGSKGIWSMRFK